MIIEKDLWDYNYVKISGIFDVPVYVYYNSSSDRVDISVPDCGCCGSVDLFSFQRSDPPNNPALTELVARSLEAADILIHRNG